MLKKKRFKFQVDLTLEELTAVSFVNGILFAKVRLLDGGSFLEMSQREEVKNNCVKWNSHFRFSCKMTANASNGVLEPCICRISVRKEVRGGKSFEKLGFKNINLAEFAGAGIQSRRYLLEGYNAKHRQDNSMLQVTLEMVLLSGDSLFKTPLRTPPELEPETQLPAEKKGDDYSGDSVASGSSGFGSLPRKQRPSVLCSDLVTGGVEDKESKVDDGPPPEFEPGHSRNSSYTSQQSKASGYHSRQSSAESGHQRNVSLGSTCEFGLLNVKGPVGKRPSKKQVPDESRMDSTRVPPTDVIKEVIDTVDLEPGDTDNKLSLQLFIKTDGAGALGAFEETVTHR